MRFAFGAWTCLGFLAIFLAFNPINSFGQQLNSGSVPKLECVTLKNGNFRSRKFELSQVVLDDFRDLDKARIEYAVHDRDCLEYFNLKVRRSDASQAVPPGSEVLLRGKRRGRSILIRELKNGPALRALRQVSAATSGHHDVLIIPAHFKDRDLECSIQEIINKVGGSAQVNTNSLYSEMSSGRLDFSPVRIMTPARLTYSASGCDYNGWATVLEQYAYYSGWGPYLYDHLIFVLPASACPWDGLGSTPGKQVWVTNCGRASVYAHELGHNLGLNHAADRSFEYGDPYDVMGNNEGLVHANTLHKLQLGWLNPNAVAPLQVGVNTTVFAHDRALPLGQEIFSLENRYRDLMLPTSQQLKRYYLSYRSNQTSHKTWPDPLRNIYLSPESSHRLEIHTAGSSLGSADTTFLTDLFDYGPSLPPIIFPSRKSVVLPGSGFRVSLISYDGDKAVIRADSLKIGVKVQSQNKRPIANQLLGLSSTSLLTPLMTYTDTGGKATWELPLVGQGFVMPAQSAFFPHSESTSVSLGNADLNLTITSSVPAYYVRGVVSVDGLPLPGAVLTFSGSTASLSRRQVRSAADGRFASEALPPGHYSLSVPAPGVFFYPQIVPFDIGNLDLVIDLAGTVGTVCDVNNGCLGGEGELVPLRD